MYRDRWWIEKFNDLYRASFGPFPNSWLAAFDVPEKAHVGGIVHDEEVIRHEKDFYLYLFVFEIPA